MILEVSWGEANLGGSCERMHDILKDVKEIQASERGFAGILATWRHLKRL